MENNYPKVYKEVIEILKYIPKESVDKIPQTMIDTFNAKMDNTYNFYNALTKMIGLTNNEITELGIEVTIPIT